MSSNEDAKADVELQASGDESKGSAIKGTDARPAHSNGIHIGTAEHVAIPTELAAKAATLGSRWNWLNWTCALLTGLARNYDTPDELPGRDNSSVLDITCLYISLGHLRVQVGHCVHHAAASSWHHPVVGPHSGWLAHWRLLRQVGVGVYPPSC